MEKIEWDNSASLTTSGTALQTVEAASSEVLRQQASDLVKQVLDEEDPDKIKDLTYLFNINQNKKSMLRINKLNNLLDLITDQAIDRFTNHSDEITTKETLDALKAVQDNLEKNQKQVNGLPETPLIQINQQTNELNLNTDASKLDKASRDRVKNAVMSLLQNIATTSTGSTPAELAKENNLLKEDDDE